MTRTGTVELHPGVRRVGSRYVDDARRVSLTVTRAERVDSTFGEARLVAMGYARLPVCEVARRGASPLHLGDLRGIQLSFRRYHAPGSAVCAVAAVMVATVLPALVMTVGFGTIALVTGLLAGDLRTTWLAVAAGVPVLIVTLVLHESAHLIVMRRMVGDRRVGAVAHSWINVWVVGPALAARDRRISAGAGPLAGAGSAVALLGFGANPWICWLVAATHLANLLPVSADGRALWASSRGRLPAARVRRGRRPMALSPEEQLQTGVAHALVVRHGAASRGLGGSAPAESSKHCGRSCRQDHDK